MRGRAGGRDSFERQHAREGALFEFDAMRSDVDGCPSAAIGPQPKYVRSRAAVEFRCHGGHCGRVVWMHDGPYSMGWHGDNASLVRDYVPVLERYHVSVLFSGHDHNYERGRRGQLNYVVTGGGGAELRPLRCGVPGKKKCKYIPAAFFNEHHYVTVDVLPRALRLCAKRPDGSPLEPCQILKR